MDAAARAELEALRRRAFGPDADIHDDPAALERLIELEDLARPAVPNVPAEATPAASEPPRDLVSAAATPHVASPPLEARHRLRVLRGTIVAGAAAAAAIVTALVLAQPTAGPMPAATPASTADEPRYVFTADPHYETLTTIRLEGAFGGYIELPTEVFPPSFPSTTELKWVTFLGDYFGWDLWIAGGLGGSEDEHCIAIRRDDQTRARCVDAEDQSMGVLRVSLAGPEISPEELPPLAEDERVRFWWREDGSIDIVLGSFGSD